MTSRKSLLLIFNPIAGRGEFSQMLFAVVDKFTKNGFEVTLHPTQNKRDAYDVALVRAPYFDYLVCSGGDGTFNEVADALMLLPDKPVLGYIPSGTTNDFASSLGLPGDILLAADAICHGQPQCIDIGQFQREYFSYVAAFGLFTDVSYGTPQNMKNMLGHAAYVLEGVKRLANIKHHRCHIVCDGEELNGDFIFGMVSNSMSIGGFTLSLGDNIAPDDGVFEVILLRRMTNVAQLAQVIPALLGAGSSSDRLVVRTASKISLSCDKPLNWTLDGEFGGSHKAVEILVHKQVIRILIPSVQPEPSED